MGKLHIHGIPNTISGVSLKFEIGKIMGKLFKIVFLAFLTLGVCQARQYQLSKMKLTGNLRFDLLQYHDTVDTTGKVTARNPKSPLTAALYSAVIPGAGQWYTESYFEGVGFISAEIALWLVYAVYNSKGDKTTADFQNYADLHWSVVQYAQWMKQYFPTQSGNIAINPNSNLPPWERVDWSQINDAEERIAQVQPTTGFTHRLPRRPEQQYYELIGKYPQYGGGWDDALGFTPSDVLQERVSEKFLLYSRMRGDANDLYRVAATASYLVAANHVLSALEAAFSAARFNSRIKLEAHIVPRRWSPSLVEFLPTVRASVAF
jgi:hypothetical protein